MGSKAFPFDKTGFFYYNTPFFPFSQNVVSFLDYDWIRRVEAGSISYSFTTELLLFDEAGFLYDNFDM